MNLIFAMILNLHKRGITTVHFSVKKCILLLLLFFTAPALFAQLTLNPPVVTDEACDGQGAFMLSLSNQAPGSAINYIVYYLGPTGTGTPVLVHDNANPSVPGQQNGVYTIEAHQFVGGNEVLPFATTQATIEDETVPLDFIILPTPAFCGGDGIITIEVTSGTAVSYKLTSSTGLVIGPQASNIFSGLQENALYTIVVTNDCGEAIPKSHNLFKEYPVYELTGAIFPDIELPACDKLTIMNNLVGNNNVEFKFPFEVKFTVTHSNGVVNIYNTTVTTGDPDMAQASVIIDYHYNEPCHYTVEFTDICGTIITSPKLDINPLLTINAETVVIKCDGRNLKLTPQKFVGPFTLQFIDPPAGFNPADFNDQYPGPYLGADAPILFGDDDTPLPPGIYKVKIFDACNRTPDAISNEVTIEVPDLEDMVHVTEIPANCLGFGQAEATIMGLPIGTAAITAGPPEYSTTYDVDVSAFIQNQGNKKRDELIVGGLPPGEYTLVLIDTCGRVYPPYDFTIKPYTGDNASSLTRPDCEEGFGTVKVSGPGFDHIEIIAAPAAYSSIHPLPHDVTEHLHPVERNLYMDKLPPGQYKFKASNGCDDDIFFASPAVVTAYSISVEDYELILHCGSFDLFINHQSTGNIFVTFSMQKWDEALGQWTEPQTGVPYEEGTEIINGPGADDEERNALKLTNNAINYNLIFPTGKYRVVKQYQSFGDGAKGEMVKFCTQTLYEFDYFSELTINGAVSLECMGNSGNVQINAFGVPPLNYRIVAHDGVPYVVENGESNIFSGLLSGVYTVEVSDQCGLTRALTFNVAEIPSLIYAPDPEDLPGIEVCDEGGDGKETFNISVYTPLVLDGQDPNAVTISYHMTQSDATAGINPLPNPTSVTTGTATIYARATHQLNPDCAAVTWFNLSVRALPALTMKDKWGGCDGNDITITADPGFAGYQWTFPSGTKIQATNQITVSDTGIYSVLVIDDFGCKISKELEVVKSPIPNINTVTISDWTDVNNVLTVVMEPTTIPGNYEYSLDNINFQSSPVFNGLTPGQYTVYVRDEFGCGEDLFETYILTYPKFFTPNGDSINEYWRINLASLEPDMLVYIYDRFGKLVFGFDAMSKGWDGTFNGKRLPATDYWFVVKRQNGQELKGHFSMIR